MNIHAKVLAFVFGAIGALGMIPPQALGASATPPRAVTSHDITAKNYPEISLRLQEQGTATLQYVVKEDGTVGAVRILKSSGHPRLDDAAVKFAQQWVYVPGTQDGQPVAVEMTSSVSFSLR